MHHRLKDVGHAQDARLEGRRRGVEVEGVAAAVGLFVMAGGPQGDLLEAPDAAQDAEGFEAVGVDDLALALVQPARLVDALLADLSEARRQACPAAAAP